MTRFTLDLSAQDNGALAEISSPEGGVLSSVDVIGSALQECRYRILSVVFNSHFNVYINLHLLFCLAKHYNALISDT